MKLTLDPAECAEVALALQARLTILDNLAARRKKRDRGELETRCEAIKRILAMLQDPP